MLAEAEYTSYSVILLLLLLTREYTLTYMDSIINKLINMIKTFFVYIQIIYYAVLVASIVA